MSQLQQLADDELRYLMHAFARLPVELVGVDLNPRSEQAARAHTPAGSAIRWVTGDYADQAKAALSVLPSSDWRTALEDLADFAVSRAA